MKSKDKLTWKRLFEYVEKTVPDSKELLEELREYRTDFMAVEKAAELVGLDPKRI